MKTICCIILVLLSLPGYRQADKQGGKQLQKEQVLNKITNTISDRADKNKKTTNTKTSELRIILFIEQ